uniref:Zygote arrest 1 truncated variant 4 n=1 Tax=Bos taurus TaxID=9913 RepID=Q1PSA3_BOVIN|nr:zygote arrest 1 truncated variant 4 [Bos taurus]ABC41753.1 zygote arrest 1 truncated variant 4 [Bos taurus]
MAALGDVVLDGYLYPACALYSYRCLYPAAAAAKGKSGADEGGWRPRCQGPGHRWREIVAPEPPAEQGAPALPVLRAEVRLLSLQGLQYPLGKCLCVVCTGH